jgi:hypothetical protein
MAGPPFSDAALVKHAEQIENKQDDQYGAEPYARASTITPTAMSVVSATAAYQQQHEYN